MTLDCELLKRYADEGDEVAFAEVVSRHTDLVYSASLRLVAKNSYLAEDVAQNVFAAMARQARALSRHSSLAGWLHTTTRHMASVAVRTEQRRRAREQEAHLMNNDPISTEFDWVRLQPVLDHAVGRLRPRDREAILLRFFQGKSHRETGELLGLTEDSARKCVERALEKMRAHFARRGITVSTVFLAATINANSVHAAPAGLAVRLGRASLAGPVSVGGLGALANLIYITMKTKILVIVSVLLIGIFSFKVWQGSFSTAEFRPDTVNHAPPGKAVEPLQAPAPTPLRSVESGPVRPVPSNQSPINGIASDNQVATSADPRQELSATIADILRILKSGDFPALMAVYRPPSPGRSEQETALAQAASADAAIGGGQGPGAQAELRGLTEAMTAIESASPSLNAAGDRAVYAVDGKGEVTFVKINGSWYVDNFALSNRAN